MDPQNPTDEPGDPVRTQRGRQAPLHLGMASIVRRQSERPGDSDTFLVTYSLQGLEIATYNTHVNSWSTLFEFLTRTLHVDHQVAEDTLIKLQLEGKASIEGRK